MTDQPYTPTIDDALDEIATILARFRSNKETIRAELDQLIAQVEAAAEQRGAAKALREAAHDWEYTLDNIPRTGVEVGDWLRNRADQMEGDNDD